MQPQVTLGVNKIIIKQLKGFKIAYQEIKDSVILEFIPDESNNLATR